MVILCFDELKGLYFVTFFELVYVLWINELFKIGGVFHNQGIGIRAFPG